MYFPSTKPHTLGNKFENGDDITNIVHVACQPSIDGRYLENFHLMKDHEEDESNMLYCKSVLEKLRNLENSNGSEPNTDQVLTLAQDSYKVCEISDCGDLCDGCTIRFYHNSMDEDEFFDEQSDVSKVSELSNAVGKK